MNEDMQEFVYQKGSERQGFRFSLAREAHLIFVQVEYETRSSRWHGCGVGIWDEREGRWKSYHVEVCPREVLAAAASLSRG